MSVLKKYMTDTEGSQASGIGRNNFRKIAEDAGAVIRIGRKRLTNMDVFYKYLESHPQQDGVKQEA